MRLRLGRARDFVYQVCHLSMWMSLAAIQGPLISTDMYTEPVPTDQLIYRSQEKDCSDFKHHHCPRSQKHLWLQLHAYTRLCIPPASKMNKLGAKTPLNVTRYPRDKMCVGGGLQAIYLSVCLYLFYPIKHAVYCTLMHS